MLKHRVNHDNSFLDSNDNKHNNNEALGLYIEGAFIYLSVDFLIL